MSAQPAVHRPSGLRDERSTTSASTTNSAPKSFTVGERTGLGRNEPVYDADGNAALSYVGAAVAIVDEIENGAFVDQRFTAPHRATPEGLPPSTRTAPNRRPKPKTHQPVRDTSGAEGVATNSNGRRTSRCWPSPHDAAPRFRSSRWCIVAAAAATTSLDCGDDPSTAEGSSPGTGA